LTALFPSAQSGQVVIGTTVIYYCVSTNQWRTLGATSGGGGGTGATPTLIVRLFGASQTTMNRNMYSTWNTNITQTSTEAHWDAYSSNLVLSAIGMWRITVRGYAQPSGSWPDIASAYGTYVSEAFSYTQTSQYFRGDANQYTDNKWQLLSNNAQTASWTDEFIVQCDSTPKNVMIAMYTETYDGSSHTVGFGGIITAQRIV
jgi:hypothetical protein